MGRSLPIIPASNINVWSHRQLWQKRVFRAACRLCADWPRATSCQMPEVLRFARAPVAWVFATDFGIASLSLFSTARPVVPNAGIVPGLPLSKGRPAPRGPGWNATESGEVNLRRNRWANMLRCRRTIVGPPEKRASDWLREARVARNVPQNLPKTATFLPAPPRPRGSSELVDCADVQPKNAGFESCPTSTMHVAARRIRVDVGGLWPGSVPPNSRQFPASCQSPGNS